MVLSMALAVGCADDSDSTGAAGGGQTLRGRIVDVDARSLLEIESLTIRDDSGESYTVEARGLPLGEFTPSHLREHMVSGAVVEVTYHDEDGRLVLDAITD